MRSGKDGEYHYVELIKDEVIKLKEIVEKKAKERANARKPSYFYGEHCVGSRSSGTYDR